MTPTLTPITRACAIAAAHLSTKTMADATPEECRACETASVTCVKQRLEEACETGDVVKVQALLQDLNRAYRTALQQVRQGRAA